MGTDFEGNVERNGKSSVIDGERSRWLICRLM